MPIRKDEIWDRLARCRRRRAGFHKAIRKMRERSLCFLSWMTAESQQLLPLINANIKRNFLIADNKHEFMNGTDSAQLDRVFLNHLARSHISPFSPKTVVQLCKELLDFADSEQKSFCFKEDDLQNVLQKYSTTHLITVETDALDDNVISSIQSIDHEKLSYFLYEKEGGENHRKRKLANVDIDIETLLEMPSAKEAEIQKNTGELMHLLNTPTFKEQEQMERFRSKKGQVVQRFCQYKTRHDCNKFNCSGKRCHNLHFIKIIQEHTDESLGDCSFLNTCFHRDTCKYVHYEIEKSSNRACDSVCNQEFDEDLLPSHHPQTTLYPPQWINCDLRNFDFKLLGKFAVIMADPPWDIHMELPYGTMSDEEMKKLVVPYMQDEGFMFLWVTGRALELGRQCLQTWGYKRGDEIIWVKTNQLQRMIRTGRTGHWLNHGKEHCLVGVKGNPKIMNRGIDCDIIVSEVRETSHKPDEIYGIIERLSPGTRKLEMFGRAHNVQPNWITLGNQLDGTYLVDPEVVSRFKKRYPDGIKL